MPSKLQTTLRELPFPYPMRYSLPTSSIQKKWKILLLGKNETKLSGVVLILIMICMGRLSLFFLSLSFWLVIIGLFQEKKNALSSLIEEVGFPAEISKLFLDKFIWDLDDAYFWANWQS